MPSWYRLTQVILEKRPTVVVVVVVVARPPLLAFEAAIIRLAYVTATYQRKALRLSSSQKLFLTRDRDSYLRENKEVKTRNCRPRKYPDTAAVVATTSHQLWRHSNNQTAADGVTQTREESAEGANVAEGAR